MRKSPFFGVIEVLDAIYVATKQPPFSEVSDPRKYYNLKVFFALKVQVAVRDD